MTRLPGWEKLLNAVIARHQALPAKYGVSDCYLITDDAVEALTGERMYPDAIGYKAGAGKKLRQHGFANVKEAFAAKFSEIPVALAQRGDIGVIDRDGVLSGGVFTAIGFMAEQPSKQKSQCGSECYQDPHTQGAHWWLAGISIRITH